MDAPQNRSQPHPDPAKDPEADSSPNERVTREPDGADTAAVSETTALDEVTRAGGADSVPETPGDNNEERPVDYGGA